MRHQRHAKNGVSRLIVVQVGPRTSSHDAQRKNPGWIRHTDQNFRGPAARTAAATTPAPAPARAEVERGTPIAPSF